MTVPSDSNSMFPAPSEGKGFASVVQVPVGMARSSKCSTASLAFGWKGGPDGVLKFANSLLRIIAYSPYRAAAHRCCRGCRQDSLYPRLGKQRVEKGSVLHWH